MSRSIPEFWRSYKFALFVVLAGCVVVQLVRINLTVDKALAMLAQDERYIHWPEEECGGQSAFGFAERVVAGPGMPPLPALPSTDGFRQRHLISVVETLHTALCRKWGVRLRFEDVIRLNRWSIVSSAFFAAVMVRMLVNSWTMALIAAALIMSRPALLGSVAHVSPLLAFGMGINAYFLASVHFFRSHSPVTFGFLVSVMALLAYLDPQYLGLACAWVGTGLVLYASHRRHREAFAERLMMSEATLPDRFVAGKNGGLYQTRGLLLLRSLLGIDRNRGPQKVQAFDSTSDYGPGKMFRGVPAPFGFWYFHAKDKWVLWAVLFMTTAVTFTFTAMRCDSLCGGGTADAWAVFLGGLGSVGSEIVMMCGKRWDLLLGFVILFACLAVGPRRGYMNLYESVLLFAATASLTMILGVFANTFCSGCSHGYGVAHHNLAGDFIYPFFPSLTALAVAGLYHLALCRRKRAGG